MEGLASLAGLSARDDGAGSKPGTDPEVSPIQNSNTFHGSSAEYSLYISDNVTSGSLPEGTVVMIGALTQVSNIQKCGTLSPFAKDVNGTLQNTTGIPYLSCDHAPDVINSMLSDIQVLNIPCAVFYSTQNATCAVTPTQDWILKSMPDLFTMLSNSSSQEILSIMSAAAPSVISAAIGPGTSVQANTTENNALIAVYVVIAICVFLLVALTVGAIIKIRRHPERYARLFHRDSLHPGNNNRTDYEITARGLARAMLDTIPLVRVAREPPPDVERDKNGEVIEQHEEAADQSSVGFSNLETQSDPHRTDVHPENDVASTGSESEHGATEKVAEEAKNEVFTTVFYDSRSIITFESHDIDQEDAESNADSNHRPREAIEPPPAGHNLGHDSSHDDNPDTTILESTLSDHQGDVSRSENNTVQGSSNARPVLYITPEGVTPTELPHASQVVTTAAKPSTTHIETRVLKEDQCPICFDDFEEGDIVRALPCSHNFHASCVDPWLLNSSSVCPFCRADLVAATQNLLRAANHPGDDSQTGNPGTSTTPEDTTRSTHGRRHFSLIRTFQFKNRIRSLLHRQ